MFIVGNTYGFVYGNKVRVMKIETIKDGPSGEVVTGLCYTNNENKPVYRSFSVDKIALLYSVVSPE